MRWQSTRRPRSASALSSIGLGAGARTRADVQDCRHLVTGSGAAGGDRFGDAGHAVEDLDGDGGLALLDVG